MSTTTPYLSLTLLATGESVGTWGIPLNNNFQLIDTLAGEVISARNGQSNIDTRFDLIESEITTARGSKSNLNERINTVINSNGEINTSSLPLAHYSSLGVTKLSTAPDNSSEPIAIGTNDSRILTEANHLALTNSNITHLHKHTLDNDIPDIIATSTEINQALHNIESSVTASHLNSLTNGSSIPSSLHYHAGGTLNSTGMVELSVTPDNANHPIAVGTNDPRMLSQSEKDQLTTNNITTLHKHNLVNGATDLTVTATVLNQLTGANTSVSASNLNILTNGSTTNLHNHNNDYYTKTESDNHNTLNQQYADNKISIHNNDNNAHNGHDLILGEIICNKLTSSASGENLVINSHTNDNVNTKKIGVKDTSGVFKMYVDTLGNLTCNDLTVNGTNTIVNTTTLNQEVIATSNLTVNGNTTLGNDNSVDILTINCLTSTIHGDLSIDGGLNTGGTINGFDINNIDNRITNNFNSITNINNEISVARDGQVSLYDKIHSIDTDLTSFKALNNNPHTVTITQAITADGGTDITVLELETLTDGSNADALHTHSAIQTELSNALNSAIYGSFTSLDERLENDETKINDLNTEIINARNGMTSLDTRLDGIDNTVSILNTNLTSLNTEVVNARNGLTDLDTRLDGIDTTILTLPKKIVSAFNNLSTINVNHNLNTTDLIVHIIDDSGLDITNDATSVTMVDVNNTTIVFSNNKTGSVVIIG